MTILTIEQLEEVSERLASEGGFLHETVRECLDAMGKPYSDAEAGGVERAMWKEWGFGMCANCGRWCDFIIDDYCENCDHDREQIQAEWDA